MARKLTDEERDAVEALSSILVEALPAEERSNASGIASSLVRLPGDRFSEDELQELMAKYEEGNGGLLKAVKSAILTPVDDEPGMYALDRIAIDAARKESAVEDEPAPNEPKQLAKQPRERAIARTGETNRASSSKSSGKEQSAAEDVPQAQAGESGHSDADGQAGAKPKRTRKRSRKASGSDISDNAEANAEPEQEKVEASAKTVGPKAVKPKPTRRRSAKSKPAEDSTAETAATENKPAADQAPSVEEQSKPKRRRRTRKAQTKDTGEAPEANGGEAADAMSAETSQEVDTEAEPKEDVRPGRAARARKRAEHEETLAAQKAAAAIMEAVMEKASAESESSSKDDGESASTADDQPDDAPKPKRRPRRRTKMAANSNAAETDPAEEKADKASAHDAPSGQKDAAEEKPAKKPSSKKAPRTKKEQEPGKGVSTSPQPEAASSLTVEAEPTSGKEAKADDTERAEREPVSTDSAEPVEKPVDEAGLKAVREKKEQKRDPRRIPYIRKGDEEDAEIRKKIVQLDPRFWMNGWLLSHPSAYTLYEHEITTMNDALANGTIVGDITRRQLAYQMGGDEKFFEYGNDGFRLLRALGMEDIVRRRPMPKIDLVYHAPRRRKHMRVLVTENLDPYLDVHDIMYEEGRSQILGERIHAVVLGAGSPVLEHNRMSLLLDNLGAESIEVLYWGDIDRAGLQILVRLNDILKDKYEFHTFAPAYKLMLQKAMERFPDPADNEPTGQVNIDMEDTALLCEGLTDEEAAYAREVIAECRLIPQEILTRRDL